MADLLKKVLIVLILTNLLSCKQKDDATLMKEWEDACGEYEIIEIRDMFGTKIEIDKSRDFNQILAKSDTCFYSKENRFGYKMPTFKIKSFAEIKAEKLDITKGVNIATRKEDNDMIIKYNPDSKILAISGGGSKRDIEVLRKSNSNADSDNMLRMYKKVKKQ